MTDNLRLDKYLLQQIPTLLLSPVPLALLQPILSRIARHVAQSRPELFNRLGIHAGKRFLIDPIDLPFVLVLTPEPDLPRMTAHRRHERPAHDAVIVGDMGVADYAARAHANLRLHLSVQAGASSPEAIRFYCQEFGVKRVVLPRMLTVAEISELHRQIPCEIEAFIFGNIGMMAEGRCSLTNYATGTSTNMDGVCSPATHVRYDEDASHNLTTRLGEFVIDRFACGESAGYPTICKGRYLCGAQTAGYYAFEEPVSLNLSALLPDLMRAGVTALKIEGRQRSRAYVKGVVSAFRKAVDDLTAGRETAFASLLALTEGRRETEGAFPSKRWR